MNKYTLDVAIQGVDNTQRVWINYPSDFQWTSYSPYIGISTQGTWESSNDSAYPYIWLYEQRSGAKSKVLLLDHFDPTQPSYSLNTGSGGDACIESSVLPLQSPDAQWSVTAGDHMDKYSGTPSGS